MGYAREPMRQKDHAPRPIVIERLTIIARLNYLSRRRHEDPHGLSFHIGTRVLLSGGSGCVVWRDALWPDTDHRQGAGGLRRSMEHSDRHRGGRMRSRLPVLRPD